jgi:outer membrane protein OmpA-like peptidoglycan-associated protein
MKGTMSMRTRFSLLLAASFALCVIAGCASSHTVVLVPDPNGQIGKAEVITSAGKQLLDKPNDMTRVSDSSAVPAPVTTASPDYIAVTFADVLAIEPLPADTFCLFFQSGSLKLTEESQKAIPTVLETIKRRGALTIAISGHTDAVGSAKMNDKLSYERAGLIQELLLQQGVDPQRVTVSSHGKGNPLVPRPDGVAEPRNRRVEVVIR